MSPWIDFQPMLLELYVIVWDQSPIIEMHGSWASVHVKNVWWFKQDSVYKLYLFDVCLGKWKVLIICICFILPWMCKLCWSMTSYNLTFLTVYDEVIRGKLPCIWWGKKWGPCLHHAVTMRNIISYVDFLMGT